MSGVTGSRWYRSQLFLRVSLAMVLLALMGLTKRNLTDETSSQESGLLELSVVEGLEKQPRPARVELLDSQGNAYVATDAVPIYDDCKERIVPPDMTLKRAMLLFRKQIVNPYTKTTQFYSAGNSQVPLPAGSYQLKVFRGPEYHVQQRQIHIQAGETTRSTVELLRWINLPEQGWYSADDHLHIPRPTREFNSYISKWMQAEDIHVANLLQYGQRKRFDSATQYAHGPEGVYQEGKYALVTGQEQPRTHFLGHTIILGERSPILFPEAYIIYRIFWEEAQRQGALSGYAHLGITHGSQYGLAIDLPLKLLNFLEVLSFDQGVYDVWYDILNTGFRMTPTAGTDYPCRSDTLPGRERFYTKVDGPWTYEAWLDGIRRGKTFVTNGPMLEFHVNGREIGDEILLKKPGPVLVKGCVRFDPDHDILEQVEIVENGQLLRSFPAKSGSSELHFQFQHHVRQSSWLGLRASGMKVDFAGHSSFRPTAVAHSAPIYITLKDGPPLSAHPRAKALARAWIARLEDLKARLSEEQNLAEWRLPSGTMVSPYGVDAEHIRKNRSALLQAIDSAEKYFKDQAR